MTRQCLTCGADFSAPPSSKKVTCSPPCSTIRRRQSHAGVSNQWSTEARAAARHAAAQTGNTRLGALAAAAKIKADPRTAPSAKHWLVMDPDNVPHAVTNLKAWLRQRLGPDEGRRVYNGLRQVRAAMRGKTRRAVTSAHGWRLADL